MDTYQPIFDAVRSRLFNCDVGAAVEQALRDANLGHYVFMASEAIKESANEYLRPSVLYRPKLFIDGDQWCALYGDNLQEGVAGFGKTPAAAMQAFDHVWTKALS